SGLESRLTEMSNFTGSLHGRRACYLLCYFVVLLLRQLLGEGEWDFPYLFAGFFTRFIWFSFT
ncbi:hypothetical protein, partial [Vibrio sp. 10N.247.310.17]|uniref:hypothetical protein n=1 Tax=Vibrio sp. 10N.247.310.17 TaxID=3229979 RepID=UPI003550FA61